MKKNNKDTESKSATLKKYKGQYSETKLMSKIARFAKSAGMECVYYVLLLVNIVKSKEVSAVDKAIVIGALGYFIVPFDLIPDLMIGTGYIDDIGMLTYALSVVSAKITPSVMETAKSDAKKSLHKYFDFKDEDFKPKI